MGKCNELFRVAVVTKAGDAVKQCLKSLSERLCVGIVCNTPIRWGGNVMVNILLHFSQRFAGGIAIGNAKNTNAIFLMIMGRVPVGTRHYASITPIRMSMGIA